MSYEKLNNILIMILCFGVVGLIVLFQLKFNILQNKVDTLTQEVQTLKKIIGIETSI